MDVLKIPFNEFVGLKLSDRFGYLLMLGEDSRYTNHLCTVHASALFALAEATSGFFLVNEFAGISDIIPVVHKVETKYRKPGIGPLFSKAGFFRSGKEEILTTLKQKGRVLVSIEVRLFNESEVCIMQSVFEWFITVKV